MNYANFIVKIVGKPQQSYFNKNIMVTEIPIKFVAARNKNLNTKNIFQISIWNNLSHDTVKNYKLNDYIIIEGYISLRPSMLNTKFFKDEKQIEISVLKIYPLCSN